MKPFWYLQDLQSLPSGPLIFSFFFKRLSTITEGGGDDLAPLIPAAAAVGNKRNSSIDANAIFLLNDSILSDICDFVGCGYARYGLCFKVVYPNEFMRKLVFPPLEKSTTPE